MGMNIFTDDTPVAKAARRRLYRREWMRKRRAQKGERWQLKVGPKLAALVRSAKPKHISLDQWLRKLIRSGLELQSAMSQPIPDGFEAAPMPLPGAMLQPGRNDPCFCGSGLKFKRCCGNAA